MPIENLRSPHDRVRGLCYFGRMLDKIRLHAAGKLPPEYHANLGGGFDARCCSFLRVPYASLVESVKIGGSDEDLLAWSFAQSHAPEEEEIEIWNEFMRKRGWNDEATPMLQKRLREGGFEARTDIATFFDFIDLDEGRELHDRSA